MQHERMDRNLEVGDVVGACRWPGVGGHSDSWGKPWMGEVLSEGDPRAWEGRGGVVGSPSAREIREKLADTRVLRQGLVPVLWHFEVKRVHWERAACLRPYEVDVEAWSESRRRAALRDSGGLDGVGVRS